MNAAQAALHHANIPDSFWDLAILDATFKYNIIPHSTTKETPLSK